VSPGMAVAVVPEEFYRKPKGVQFKKPYRMRENAIRYAEEHSCRVVIACEDEGRYDVLCDPCSIAGPRVSFELVVDRGELIAVPCLTPSYGESPEPSTALEPDSSGTSQKMPWNFVPSWLRG
jgi:hypothetical protein